MAEGEAPPRFLEKNALWLALGAIAVAGALVAVGIQVAPERFYDHFWWEDIWGPLVVDAHQCKTDIGCPGVVAPHGVPAKDGYTITSELTYGAVLAVMLYGIYMGLFRRHGIVPDGWFVLALVPWILLGPLARALEDADVFCIRNGAGCDPSPFAFLYISPVIYIQIAVYVIGAMLLGLWIQRRREDVALTTRVMAGVLGAGFLSFLLVKWRWGSTFGVLPPWWVVLLACAFAWIVFAWRATEGRGTMNATVFSLGLPFALCSIYLVGWWLTGHVWSPTAWGGRTYVFAGFFILAVAILTALGVWALARLLVARGVEARWARATGRTGERTLTRVGYAGVAFLAFALLAAGIVPNLAAFFDGVARKDVVIPAAALGGTALLAVYAFLRVGRDVAKRPGLLLTFALGINVALVLGHVIDGMSTWVALDDPFGFGLPQYSEKHPFSEFLLRYWGGFLYPFAKVLLVLVVVWVLDREPAEGRADDRNMVGLVKMAIFVLGFAPGVRDLLRLAMGV